MSTPAPSTPPPAAPKPPPAPPRIEPMKAPPKPQADPAYTAALKAWEVQQRMANCLADMATHAKRQHDTLAPLIATAAGTDTTQAQAALDAAKAFVNALAPGTIS